ncbi:HAD family hydrolase [Haloarcula salinisoli]|uniref:HAD family hydrolase n=1 Tax=Haloarcula salinisoli TaxID=2487746 RepID=A0A8J7YAV9_9EURY|nr:HAD family hydrolase [Halomicroarcula salinisoli]MBX0286449.1 HAD family hydrolase [Halomicroarcula salinisoli]MBX0302062.1 HAD family hydrolase [Halomicroarcula salinisoli]
MEQYDRLYRLYETVDTETVRAYQELVDLFPALRSTVGLEQWERARTELDERKAAIAEQFPDPYAEIAAHLTREEAFTALDLYAKYDRTVNVLVLDVDETLRSAGDTDNEIPRSTLHLLTEFHERGVPIVVCTGQTLENVKGFMIQGLGNDVVSSGALSVVYETGNAAFTPNHGADTKRLLYEGLDPVIVETFDDVRGRVLSDAPDSVRRGCHLQGNEFNVTIKPNAEVGSDDAVTVIDEAVRYFCGLVGEALAGAVDTDVAEPELLARTYFAKDPEIAAVFDDGDLAYDADLDGAPSRYTDALERIDVGYYEGDAAELVSLELDKPTGVRAALDVLGIEDPFALSMGDSKSDLRVMEWLADTDSGIAAAPEHASQGVLDHVNDRDELVYTAGEASSVLKIVYGMELLAGVEAA